MLCNGLWDTVSGFHLVASLSEKDDTLQSCGNGLGKLTLTRPLENKGMKSNGRRSYESSQVSMPDLISCNLAKNVKKYQT